MSSQVDWPRLLGDLQYLLGEATPGNPNVRIPVGRKALGSYLVVHHSTVRNWLDGAEPKHSDGERLVIAWERLTGKTRAFVPITKVVLSAKAMKERA